jgi:hypothetical protein
LGHLNFGHWDLFRLPARSRFGEGRDFDIRISDLLNPGGGFDAKED